MMAPNPYPYDMPCSKAGCSETFRVHTPNFESSGLAVAMRFYMEAVHQDYAPPSVSAKREKAEDIDKSCVPRVSMKLPERNGERGQTYGRGGAVNSRLGWT